MVSAPINYSDFPEIRPDELVEGDQIAWSLVEYPGVYSIGTYVGPRLNSYDPIYVDSGTGDKYRIRFNELRLIYRKPPVLPTEVGSIIETTPKGMHAPLLWVLAERSDYWVCLSDPFRPLLDAMTLERQVKCGVTLFKTLREGY